MRGRMMLKMKRITPNDEMQDGFESAQLPPIGPDGAPDIPPVQAVPSPRPTLCQAGPCRNYHRLELEVDAALPMPVTVPIRLPRDTPGVQQSPKGTVYTPPADLHTQINHYCYPAEGIEIELGSTSVVQCNRWAPSMGGGALASLEAYERALEAWAERHRQEADGAYEVHQLIEQINKTKETP